MTSSDPYRIDIHHHCIPAEVVEIYERLGIRSLGGLAIPQATTDEALRALIREIPPEAMVEHFSHVRETLARLYYDTAVSSQAPTVAAVKELVGAGGILYGTDFPAGPEPVNYLNTRLLEQCDLAEDELRRIERENALALLS